MSRRPRPLERQTNAIQQFLRSIGLRQVADCAALNRLPAHPSAGKDSDKADRDGAALVRQNSLQLERAQARHPDIQDQTRRLIGSIRLQISLRGYKGLTGEAERSEKVDSRRTDWFVVIDY